MDKPRLPHEASEYLERQFPDGVQLGPIRTEKDEAGHTVFVVPAGDSSMSYMFRFSEEGKLIRQDARPAYPDGFQDSPQDEFHPDDI